MTVATPRVFLQCAAFSLLRHDHDGALVYLRRALHATDDWRYRRLILTAIRALALS